MKTNWREISIYMLIAALSAYLYYYKFLDNFFVNDDFKYLENMFNSPLSVILGYGNLRVVSNVAWWPQYALSGLDPFGYNLFGVVMHAANAVLVYLLLVRLLKDKVLAIICGAIFLFNSVGCDALFWKAASNTLINVFFYLTTLYLYIVSRQEGSKKYYVLSMVSFLLAIFSKEDAASMPFILLLLELTFFDGFTEKKKTILRVIPYVAIILFYILAGELFFNIILNTRVEHANLFKIRPLYSLLAGWTVFFLPPHGNLALNNPLIYLTAAASIASFFWVQNKRLLYFGYGWIFFAFLPQSFTSHGQFETTYIVNSISRYHYITSIGSSLVFSAIIINFRERFSSKVYGFVLVLFFTTFIMINYRSVQMRGNQWKETGEPTARFINAIKTAIPIFPPNSYIYVKNAPAGRAFVQQSLRSFYGNLGITWIIDPDNYFQKPGDSTFLVKCNWKSDGNVNLDIR